MKKYYINDEIYKKLVKIGYSQIDKSFDGLIYDVMKWLREEKHFYIEISPVVFPEGKVLWCAKGYSNPRVDDFGNTLMIGEYYRTYEEAACAIVKEYVRFI